MATIRRAFWLTAVVVLAGACQPQTTSQQICETRTPGFGGAPVPTSCHPATVFQGPEARSSAGSQTKGDGGASTPRQRP